MKDLKADDFTEDRISIRRSLDMRYVGQVHECTVAVEAFAIDEAALERLKQAFHTRHEELYTYSEPQSAVEVVNVESAISGAVDRPTRMVIAAGHGAHTALKGTRPMIFNAEGTPQDTPVYDGALLGAGDALLGPAVIQEVTTTLVIEPGWQAELHATGVYIVTQTAAG
jgi:N-methylhydantoinase A